MKSRILLGVLFIMLFSKCKTESEYLPISINSSENFKKSEILEDQKYFWHHKDIIDDSIPGVSLEKAYNTVLREKKGKEVVVAVIDMSIDINHEDLKNNIWINSNEIPNNNIDDDGNGYIDDINGWNFLGNSDGDNIKFVNYEYTRIIRKLKDSFSEVTSNNRFINDSSFVKMYKNATDMYEDKQKFALEDTAYINMVQNAKQSSQSRISKYFNVNNLNTQILDSLKRLSLTDSLMQMEIVKFTNFLKYGYTDEFIDDYKLKANERIFKLLNIDYDDRAIVGDDEENLNDISYGNNKVNAQVGFFNHGTLMAGIIAAERGNNLGINGFSNNIKIMPLAISSFGDEHDKDIALAIRYAVNNGAKVINMSFGKEFSLYKEWVLDAIKYAEQKNVIIVRSAGNLGHNLNEVDYSFPNDMKDDGSEISDNFLLVGAITYNLNEGFLPKYSNYGSQVVDVFAPGGGFKTTSTKPEKYEIALGGTSNASAIVSGIAALIFSHYPNLTASQVKHIIMDSGIEFKFIVNLPSQKDKSLQKPFNELSKSGKIVNAYNALILARQTSLN